MKADLEKLAQGIRPTTEAESRATGLADADAGLVEQRINRLRRIADEMGDLPAREALWHYARAVDDMHGEIESEMRASVEQRSLGVLDAAKGLADLGGQVPEAVLAHRRWLAENHDALQSSNEFVDQHGLPLGEHWERDEGADVYKLEPTTPEEQRARGLARFTKPKDVDAKEME